MSFLFKPWHLLVFIADGAAHGDHQRAIEYLMAESRVLNKNSGSCEIPLAARVADGANGAIGNV